jgi:hypothetical protein
MPSLFDKLFQLRFELEALTRAENDWQRARVLAKASTVFADFYSSFVGGYEERLDELWRVARQHVGRAAVVTAQGFDPGAPRDVDALFEKLVSRVESMRRMGDKVESIVDCLLVMISTESIGLGAPSPSDGAAFHATERRALAILKAAGRSADNRAIVTACFRAIGYGGPLGRRKSKERQRRAKAKVVALKRKR